MSLRVARISGAASTPTATLRVAQISGASSTPSGTLRVARISGAVTAAPSASLRVARISGTITPLPTVSAGPSQTVGAWDLVTLTGSPAGGAWTKISGAGTTPGAGTSVTVTAVPSNTPGATAVAVYRYTHTSVTSDVSVTSGSAEDFYITAGTSKAMWNIWLDEYGSGSYGLGSFGG